MLAEIEKEGYRNIKVGCIHKASKCSSSWTRERRPAAAASTLPTYTRKEFVSLCASSLTLSPQGTIIKETINKTAKSLALWWSQVQLSHWNSLVSWLHWDSFQVLLMHRTWETPTGLHDKPTRSQTQNNILPSTHQSCCRTVIQKKKNTKRVMPEGSKERYHWMGRWSPFGCSECNLKFRQFLMKVPGSGLLILHCQTNFSTNQSLMYRVKSLATTITFQLSFSILAKSFNVETGLHYVDFSEETHRAEFQSKFPAQIFWHCIQTWYMTHLLHMYEPE